MNSRVCDYYSNSSLSYVTLNYAFVLPYNGINKEGRTRGGVVSSEGNYVDNSGLHEEHGCGYNFSQNEIVVKTIPAIYLGMWFPIWGHCLTDNIKKLWFLQTEKAKKIIQDGCDLVYVVMMNDKYSLSQSFIDLLATLGIKIQNLCEINKITRYDRIYIPDDSTFLKDDCIYYTQPHILLRQSILQNLPRVPIKTYPKVYFSRSQFKRGKTDIGERRIEDIFRYLNYKIIYPEKLSFAEQVTLLQNCTHFASTEGSTSHNTFFCRPQTEVCIIRKADYINEYQIMINDLCDLRVTYIKSHLSILVDKNKPWNGPFFLYVSNELCQFANIPIAFNNFSLRQFKKYVQISYSKHKGNIDMTNLFDLFFDEVNTSYFCKNFIKRFLRYILCNGRLSLLVPLYNYINRKSIS